MGRDETRRRPASAAGGAVNESEHNIRESEYEDQASGWDLGDADGSGLPDVPSVGLGDLSPAAADRIHLFLAESTVRGGASPGDVADLYTSQEIMADDAATAYLDSRFVRGDVPRDWRELQDRLSLAHYDGPPAASAEALLTRVRGSDERAQSARSIFDDPEDDEFDDEDRSGRVEDRDPNLSDLYEDARQSIERMIVSEVLCYGVAPYKVMQLREDLRASGDERALQYLDLPFELGDRPGDWESLRDRALMTRGRLESLGADPSAAYAQADGQHPDVPAANLLDLIEDQATQR
jgi:hypothetical protein